MIVFVLFIAMLVLIAVGIFLHTPILANLIALTGITGLMVLFFHRPEHNQGKLNLWLQSLTAQQQKQWYGLFIVSAFFGVMFGSFWNTSMGSA